MNLKTIDYLKNPDKKNLLLFTGSIMLCLSAGLISKIFVTPEALIWYEYLLKPALTPPAWLFQDIWAVLYLLMGISLYLVLNSENINQDVFLDKLKKLKINPEPCLTKGNKKYGLIIFGIQLSLSILLIPVFLGLKSVFGGFVISILMLASVCLMLYKFYKITIPAALLIIPSVLWSAYLVGLNLTFWILNNTQWIF